MSLGKSITELEVALEFGGRGASKQDHCTQEPLGRHPGGGMLGTPASQAVENRRHPAVPHGAVAAIRWAALVDLLRLY